MTNKTEIEKLWLIRANLGEQPRTKNAAIEAMRYARFVIYFVHNNSSGNSSILKLSEMKPGETISYTDGQGKYFGTVTRPLDEQCTYFVFDGKTDE